MTRVHLAVVRKPGPNLGAGLTTASMGSPDYHRALQQHSRYVTTLESAGAAVTMLEPLPTFPDAYFVEDVAVITPELAVMTRPGAPERRGEAECMGGVLSRYRPLAHIREPGCLDGGDVLVMGQHVLIGLSSRTNHDGARQLLEVLAPYGYRGDSISVGEGLNIKSSVNIVAKDTLIVTREFAQHEILADYGRIVVDDEEAYAANVLRINDVLIVPTGFHRTRAQLENLGGMIVELDVSEMRKMDGGLTCLSLRL